MATTAITSDFGNDGTRVSKSSGIKAMIGALDSGDLYKPKSYTKTSSSATTSPTPSKYNKKIGGVTPSWRKDAANANAARDESSKPGLKPITRPIARKRPSNETNSTTASTSGEETQLMETTKNGSNDPFFVVYNDQEGEVEGIEEKKETKTPAKETAAATPSSAKTPIMSNPNRTNNNTTSSSSASSPTHLGFEAKKKMFNQTSESKETEKKKPPSSNGVSPKTASTASFYLRTFGSHAKPAAPKSTSAEVKKAAPLGVQRKEVPKMVEETPNEEKKDDDSSFSFDLSGLNRKQETVQKKTVTDEPPMKTVTTTTPPDEKKDMDAFRFVPPGRESAQPKKGMDVPSNRKPPAPKNSFRDQTTTPSKNVSIALNVSVVEKQAPTTVEKVPSDAAAFTPPPMSPMDKFQSPPVNAAPSPLSKNESINSVRSMVNTPVTNAASLHQQFLVKGRSARTEPIKTPVSSMRSFSANNISNTSSVKTPVPLPSTIQQALLQGPVDTPTVIKPELHHRQISTKEQPPRQISTQEQPKPTPIFEEPKYEDSLLEEESKKEIEREFPEATRIKKDMIEFQRVAREIHFTKRAIEEEMESGSLTNYEFEPEPEESVNLNMWLGGIRYRTMEWNEKEQLQGVAFGTLESRGSFAGTFAAMDMAPFCGQLDVFNLKRYKVGIQADGRVIVRNAFPGYSHPLYGWTCALLNHFTCGEVERGIDCYDIEKGIDKTRDLLKSAAEGAKRRGVPVENESLNMWQDWNDESAMPPTLGEMDREDEDDEDDSDEDDNNKDEEEEDRD